jgi:hypothetical protein
MRALKYLFKVKYKDDSEYHQGSSDISITDSERSAYSDVVQENVKQFWIEDESGKFIMGVDLENGYFKIDDGNGWVKHHHEEGCKDYKLVYFRRNVVVLTDGNSQPISTIYFIGWRANSPGGDVEYTVETT